MLAAAPKYCNRVAEGIMLRMLNLYYFDFWVRRSPKNNEFPSHSLNLIEPCVLTKLFDAVISDQGTVRSPVAWGGCVRFSASPHA